MTGERANKPPSPHRFTYETLDELKKMPSEYGDPESVYEEKLLFESCGGASTAGSGADGGRPKG